ncbi:MAG: hypothetical protein JKY48_08350 [Flavobacteriales bacterium]|nr:hypothetical protein [Flavobacteriales bacterium]
MKNYRINKNNNTNPGGHNEVHNQDCRYYNQLTNYEYLGQHPNCYSAVSEAKRRGYERADGCAICSGPCNNG